eukprot:ANDGO_04329.mRNA.1 Nitrilase homolog 2
MEKLRVALIQFSSTVNKSETLAKARELIRRATKEHSAHLVVLPECFNSPYGTKYFKEYAENLAAMHDLLRVGSEVSAADFQFSESMKMLSEAAKENNVFLVGGSVPESRVRKCTEELYNSTVVFGPSGVPLAHYSKMHLFNIDIPGKITFRESEVLTPGEKPAVFRIGPWNIGLGICFDMRFPELVLSYANKHNCQMVVFPGAFNMTTGPAHWELLIRARALDGQCYVAACSPARDEAASYVAYGNSMVVDPWGEVLMRAGSAEEIIVTECTLEKAEEIRNAVPIREGRRPISEFL